MSELATVTTDRLNQRSSSGESAQSSHSRYIRSAGSCYRHSSDGEV